MYSKDEERTIANLYIEGQTPEAIAEVVGRPTKSVIAKLSLMGIYKPKSKVSKVTGAAPKTKAAFVKDICDLLGRDELLGLDKAPKATLMKLVELIEDLYE